MSMAVSSVNDDVIAARSRRPSSWPLEAEQEMVSQVAVDRLLTGLIADPETLNGLNDEQLKQVMARAGREAIEALHQSFAPVAVAGETMP